MNVIELRVNNYTNAAIYSRQLLFSISELALREYLDKVGDKRDIDEFCYTHTSDDAEVIYEYMNNDNRILSESISYCDDFEEKYINFINTVKILLTLIPAPFLNQFATKEQYYWSIYVELVKNEKEI